MAPAEDSKLINSL